MLTGERPAYFKNAVSARTWDYEVLLPTFSKHSRKLGEVMGAHLHSFYQDLEAKTRAPWEVPVGAPVLSTTQRIAQNVSSGYQVLTAKVKTLASEVSYQLGRLSSQLRYYL